MGQTQAVSYRQYERTKNDHNTPESVLQIIRAFRVIGLDPCSNPWSSVGARIELSKHRGDDGLAQSWASIVDPDELVYWNPPYGRGRIKPCIEKAAFERDVESIGLVPCSPETEWARLALAKCDAMIDWGQRIPFVRDTRDRNGAKGASRLFYFGPNRYKFAHHFEPYAADVRVFSRRTRMGRAFR